MHERQPIPTFHYSDGVVDFTVKNKQYGTNILEVFNLAPHWQEKLNEALDYVEGQFTCTSESCPEHSLQLPKLEGDDLGTTTGISLAQLIHATLVHVQPETASELAVTVFAVTNKFWKEQAEGQPNQKPTMGSVLRDFLEKRAQQVNETSPEEGIAKLLRESAQGKSNHAIAEPGGFDYLPAALPHECFGISYERYEELLHSISAVYRKRKDLEPLSMNDLHQEAFRVPVHTPGEIRFVAWMIGAFSEKLAGYRTTKQLFS